MLKKPTFFNLLKDKILKVDFHRAILSLQHLKMRKSNEYFHRMFDKATKITTGIREEKCFNDLEKLNFSNPNVIRLLERGI
jgi:hypothetical protein